MAQADNAYSRLIRWLKIVLPLVALALMSSIFQLTRKIDPTEALPYSRAELDDRAREPRLTQPKYSGMTSDGALVTIDAAEARPDLADPGRGKASEMVGTMQTPDGEVTDLAADAGQVDTVKQVFAMQGNVTLTNSAGYRVSAPEVTGSTAETLIDATGGVKGQAPMGPLTSDTLHIRPDPNVPGQYVLVFNGRVRLVYDPKQ